MIALDQTQEVIEILLSYSASIKNQKLQNLLVVLNSRLIAIENRRKLGPISDKEFRTEKSKINSLLLEIIDDFSLFELNELPEVDDTELSNVYTAYRGSSFISKVVNFTIAALFLVSVVSVLSLLIYNTLLVFNDNDQLDHGISYSSVSIGFTGMIASGIFYFSNKLLDHYLTVKKEVS